MAICGGEMEKIRHFFDFLGGIGLRERHTKLQNEYFEKTDWLNFVDKLPDSLKFGICFAIPVKIRFLI